MKKTLLILLRVLLLIGSIAVLITAFSRSVHVANIRDRYIKDVVVVIATNHIGETYNNHYKYIYDDTEYDKMIPDQTHKNVGTTEIIWVNPSDPDDFIFDSELERQDNGAILFKTAIAGVVLFIFSFILVKPDKDSQKPQNPVVSDNKTASPSTDLGISQSEETKDIPEELKALWKSSESDSKSNT